MEGFVERLPSPAPQGSRTPSATAAPASRPAHLRQHASSTPSPPGRPQELRHAACPRLDLQGFATACKPCPDAVPVQGDFASPRATRATLKLMIGECWPYPRLALHDEPKSSCAPSRPPPAPRPRWAAAPTPRPSPRAPVENASVNPGGGFQPPCSRPARHHRLVVGGDASITSAADWQPGRRAHRPPFPATANGACRRTLRPSPATPTREFLVCPSSWTAAGPRSLQSLRRLRQHSPTIVTACFRHLANMNGSVQLPVPAATALDHASPSPRRRARPTAPALACLG